MALQGTRGRKRFWLFLLILLGASFTLLLGNVLAQDEPETIPSPLYSERVPFGEEFIHYMDTGEADLPLVIFIHGTPGSWGNFRHFMHYPSLRRAARMVSLDRPGFGKSNAGELVLTLEEQAAAIEPLLDLNRSGKKTILVGHSLGGPIAARVAMDYPSRVDGIFLVAPTLDPELERTKWYQALGRTTLIRWMVPKALFKANKELKNLRQELRDMLPLWENIDAETIVLQGGKDPLVDPGNADFVSRMLPEERLEVWFHEEISHFIPWKQPELMVEGILQLIEK